mmetsp:Transcript_18649/g.51490  ORF Transcript_18649/g.51490 Transcript_18649/m.51490 type:complete len:88 (-) Transcript_18649:165-428(-)
MGTAGRGFLCSTSLNILLSNFLRRGRPWQRRDWGACGSSCRGSGNDGMQLGDTAAGALELGLTLTKVSRSPRPFLLHPFCATLRCLC